MSTFSHASILIIEDEMAEVVMLKRFFTQEKISNAISYAPNICAAKRALEQETFDLCFIDVSLPDGEGFELLKQIDTERTTIIMLSQSDNVEHLLTAQKLGAKAYITKPLTKAKLDFLVKELRELSWSMVMKKRHISQLA